MQQDRSPIEPTRLAWIAGLIEGEGWLDIRDGRRPIVQVMSTDLDVLERLRDWTGVGNLRGPRVRPDRKPVWNWTVAAREDAGWLMEELLPWLMERRRAKAQAVVDEWRAAPPKRGMELTCKHGHPFSGDNLYFADGRRRCRACQNRRQREYTARKRAAQTS